MLQVLNDPETISVIDCIAKQIQAIKVNLDRHSDDSADYGTFYDDQFLIQCGHYNIICDLEIHQQTILSASQTYECPAEYDTDADIEVSSISVWVRDKKIDCDLNRIRELIIKNIEIH